MTRKKRPTMPERYLAYIDAASLSTFVKELYELYTETGSEKAYSLYKRFEVMATKAQRKARRVEIRFNREDFNAILDNPHLFPHSVVTWAHAEYNELKQDGN
jgi:hypothetical protein